MYGLPNIAFGILIKILSFTTRSCLSIADSLWFMKTIVYFSTFKYPAVLFIYILIGRILRLGEFLFIIFLPGYAVYITQGINFHIPLWWRHNGLKCITVEMTLDTYASERLLKKSGVTCITCDKKNLPCFGVGYDFYPTSCVFSTYNILWVG